MINKEKITRNWLRRYTGTDPDDFGDWILLTNFQNYVEKFVEKFDIPTDADGLSIINYGMGSANAATIMDLLSGIHPKGVLFLGKCGGLTHMNTFLIRKVLNRFPFFSDPCHGFNAHINMKVPIFTRHFLI